MTGHTPGPWTVAPDGLFITGHHWDDGGPQSSVPVVLSLASCGIKPKDAAWPRLQADARLIASAPDMLSALQRLVDAVDAESDGAAGPGVQFPAELKATIEQARAALRAAKGE